MAQHLITSVKELEELNSLIEVFSDFIALDTETNGLHHIKDKVVGISLAFDGQAYYIPCFHKEGNFSTDSNIVAANVRELLYLLQKKHSVMHNSLFDTSMLYRTFGVVLNAEHDTMAMAYVVNEESMGLDALSYKYFNYQMGDYKDLLEASFGKKWKSKNLNFSDLNPSICLEYAASDAYYTLMLKDVLLKRVEELSTQGVYKLEMRLIPVIRKMNFTGVLIDAKLLIDAAIRMKRLNDEREQSIFKLAGGKFAINSPVEAAEVVFGKLGLPVIKRSEKTGRPSLGKDVLEVLETAHPIIPMIGKWRSDARLVKAYAEKIPLSIEPDSGKIYTHFSSIGAVSGRLTSSSDEANDGEDYGVNFQNISKKDLDAQDQVFLVIPKGLSTTEAFGKKLDELIGLGCQETTSSNPQATKISVSRDADVRSAFVAPEDYVWLKADYSQIEYRVMASLANEQTLVKKFKEGADFHTITAAFMLGKKQEDITKEERQRGKVFNFGLSYGMTAFSLAKRTGMTEEEAEAKYKEYFEAVPRLAQLIANARAFAEANGYTRTYFGRRRFLNTEGLPGNIVVKILRKAFNTLIQGTAADLLKIAMVRVSEAIKPFGKDVQLLLTVHDELDFVAKKERLQEIAIKIKEAMEIPVPEEWAPIKVDLEVGKSWSAKDLKTLDIQIDKPLFVSWKDALPNVSN